VFQKDKRVQSCDNRIIQIKNKLTNSNNINKEKEQNKNNNTLLSIRPQTTSQTRSLQYCPRIHDSKTLKKVNLNYNYL
jgi:hypothetical protein